MKRILLAFCLTMTAMGCWAQDYKVLEKSQKKRPEWVGISGNGYIAVGSQKPTLDEARQDCMNILLEEIINAVAVNVCSQTSSDLMQITRNEA